MSSARANGYRLLGIHSREELAALLAAPEPVGPTSRRPALLTASCMVLVLLVAVAATVVPALTAQPVEQATVTIPSSDQVPFTATAEDGTVLFGLNERGMFFGGRAFSVEYLAGRLDLVTCYGTEGERGYCRSDQLSAGHPAGQEDEIALYTQDGTTRVGTFLDVDADLDAYDVGSVPFTARAVNGEELFGRNENGQLFASPGFEDLYLRGEADLVRAEGAGGQVGYVSEQELTQAGWDHTTEVSLYEKDGQTVIGTFPLSYD